MKLTLARDGIFPITKDATGKPLPLLPASGFNFPGTIQGEGKLNGIPSLFIRLAGCNLYCCWKNADGSSSPCDTAYASFAIKNSFSISTDEICNTIRANTDNINHIVLTGGEPLLQAKGLKDLCHKLKENKNYHLTIETNATLFDESLSHHIDFFSLSPKLCGSIPTQEYTPTHNLLRINIPVIQSYITHACENNKDFQLKFVCTSESDVNEIHSLLSKLNGWKNEDVLLMPAGGNPKDLLTNSKKTLVYSIRNGWRYCDRLHISVFGAKDGV